MNLKDVRLLFAEWSGRADLININGSDAGADNFIRAASDWLDEETDRQRSVARHVISVAIGDYKAEIPRCMGIPQVWVMGSDLNGQHIRFQLQYKSLTWIREEYNEPWITTDGGVPSYYALNVVSLDGSQFDYDSADELSGLDDVTDIHDYDDTEADGPFIYNGLLWMPPAETAMTMNLFGNFYEKKLELDTDINYWTVCKPLTLVKTACMQHESSLRNKQGFDDWKAMVDSDLDGVDKAEADMGVAAVNEMEG